ncbi:MAG: LuxR C-terminal-related transcriptional regulator, partial [Acidiferrobacter sp.]
VRSRVEAAVMAVARGRTRDMPSSPTPPAPIAPLTPRECQILQHLAAGSSNKAIARALAITDGSVKLHVKSIFRKLHVDSRVEAAVMAVAQERIRDTRSPP